MTADSSPWPLLTGLLGSLAGIAALGGWLLNRRRMPAEVRLITVQTEVAEATRSKTEAERDSIAFNVISKALADAERTLERLWRERDEAQAEGRRKDERIAQLEAQVKALQLELIAGETKAAEGRGRILPPGE